MIICPVEYKWSCYKQSYSCFKLDLRT